MHKRYAFRCLLSSNRVVLRPEVYGPSAAEPVGRDWVRWGFAERDGWLAFLRDYPQTRLRAPQRRVEASQIESLTTGEVIQPDAPGQGPTQTMEDWLTENWAGATPAQGLKRRV